MHVWLLPWIQVQDFTQSDIQISPICASNFNYAGSCQHPGASLPSLEVTRPTRWWTSFFPLGKEKCPWGDSKLHAEAWKALEAIITTAGLERMSKLGREIKKKIKKCQHTKSAQKISNSSVIPVFISIQEKEHCLELPQLLTSQKHNWKKTTRVLFALKWNGL